MSANNYIDKHDSGENLQDTPSSENTGLIEDSIAPTYLSPSETSDIAPLVKSVMTVYYPSAEASFYDWAELEVEYSWNASGSSFTCHTLRYRVINNGRRKGNIVFGFHASTSWQNRELTGNAIQDGNWHPISAGGSVQGSTNSVNTARIYFKYTFDVGLYPDYWASVERTLKFLPAPTITNPVYAWTDKPTLYGEGVHGATVKLYESGVGTILFGTAMVTSTQRWSTSLSNSLWQADPFSMTASQTLDGITSDWAIPFNIAVLFKPIISTITVPTAGKPTVTGTGGLKGATLLAQFHGSGGLYQFTTTVLSDGKWSVPADRVLPSSNYTVTAKQIGKVSGKSSDWSEPKTITIKPLSPVITSPPSPAASKQVLTIAGVAVGNVTLKMFIRGDAQIPGTFSSSGTTRTFTPTADWAAGITEVRAAQTVDGVASDPSEWVSVVIKPPKPAITPPPSPAAAKQVLTITGVSPGIVTLAMYTEGGSQVTGTFSSSGTTRTFTPAADWTLTNNKVRVTQIVGYVASDPSDLVTLVLKPLSPVITPPPSPAASKQVLTIAGVAVGNVTLKMFTRGDAQIPGTFSSSGTTRTFTPTADWAAGITEVRAVQTVDGVASDPSEWVSVVIKPPKPAITPPPEWSTAKQTLTITGVSAGTATLAMYTEEGSQVTGTFSSSGTTRTFTPSADWAAGITEVRVVQTVDGVASDPSEWVIVMIKPPKPAITPPPSPAAVKQVLTITGISSESATLTMRTEVGSLVTGAFSASGTTRTFTPTADWAPGINKVKATQIVGYVMSDPSDLATLAVKPAKPAITPPPNPAAADQVLTVTGVSPGTVTLKMLAEGGTEIAGTFSSSGTSRTFTPSANWAAGTSKVKVVQTVGGVASDPSDLATLAVKPAKPAITPPPNPAAANQVLTVTGVSPGTVALKMLAEGGTEIAGTFSSSGTSRTFTPSTNWAAGTSKVKVVQTVGGVASDPSDLATLAVRPPKPAITPPPNPAAANQVLTVTGVSSGTVALKMLAEGGTEIAGTFSSSGTSRTFTPAADWAAGTNKVSVVQTVDGVASDPSDECTFTVEEEDKPDAPRFELPLPGSKTSTRPIIRVTGEPYALLTVRHEDAQPLHSDSADAEGILEFEVATPLIPGPNALEVKQKADGPDSAWSDPHRFTVKEPPRTPEIDAPTPGSFTPRKPTIRGKGETRGQIQLRHADDPDNLIDTLNGVTSWRWTAKQSWDLGHYTVQVRQADDGDSSEWSEPRTFEVADLRYGIGDAGPVLAQPVVSNHESVLLRVQVVSGTTGEAAEGVTVQWHTAGEQAVISTTVTGPDGWARYVYTPQIAGQHIVLADLTSENQGLELAQQFEIIALPDDAWAQTFELYLEGEKLDLAKEEIQLLNGRSYDLALKVNSPAPQMSATATLQDLADADALGLRFDPPLGIPQSLENGLSVHWVVSCDTDTSGYFGLNLTSSILPDWHLPGRLIAKDLNEETELYFDTFVHVFGGATAYPCIGATHTLTVKPRIRSWLLGKDVALELTEEAGALGVTISPAPDSPQSLGPDGASWSLDCVNTIANGRFAVHLKVRQPDLESLQWPMSLGHNKVSITERFGPTQTRSPAFDFTYGIRAASSFTGLAAGNVPVIVEITGQMPMQRPTDQTGWLYVHYFAGESARLTIHNLYDGSTA